MDLIDEQRSALAEMRQVLAEFSDGRATVAEFLPPYRRLFAPFDPPDLTTSALDEFERSEVYLYIRIMGGWFGEDDHLVPKHAEWEYGTHGALLVDRRSGLPRSDSRRHGSVFRVAVTPGA